MDDALRQLVALAKDAYGRRDYAQAREALEAVATRHDGFADVFHMLGVVYHDGGLFTKAQQAWERALELNPGYTEAALNLSVLYNDMGRYDAARETYARALQRARLGSDGIDPFVSGKIANMHAEIGDAYRGTGQARLAVGEYEKALQLRPTFADIRTRLAITLMECKQFAVAVQELHRALHDRPDYVPARVQLGICCYCMGRPQEAVEHWTRVMEADPANPSVAMYLRVVRASLAEQHDHV